LFDAPVYALAAHSGALVVGGDFEAVTDEDVEDLAVHRVAIWREAED